MEKTEFKITIDAPRETVWAILWGNATYPEWTAVFGEGSRAETDWKEGSRVVFLDGKNDGMISIIESNVPNEYMSFKYIGKVKKGVEDLDSEEVRKWAGFTENYTLKTVGSKTEVVIDMALNDEYKDYFLKTWPKALEKLKELAEAA